MISRQALKRAEAAARADRARSCDRRPGVGQHRRSGYRGFGSDDARRLRFSTGTFTRSTDGWYYPDGDSQTLADVNVLRSLDNPDDGLLPLTLLECARTNVIARSNKFTNAPPWVYAGGLTVAGDVATDPNGTAFADRITFTAAAGDAISQPFLGATADNNQCALSIWLRHESATKNLRLRLVKKDATTVDVAITVDTTWRRYILGGPTAVVGVGVPAPQFVLLNDAAGTAGSVLAWGAQAETDTATAMRMRAPSAIIPTTGDGSATRGVDQLTWAAGGYDIGLFNGRWKFDFAPYWIMGGAENESAGQQLDLISFGGTQNYVALTGTQQIIAVQGNVVKVTKAAITSNRHQRITITIEPATGSITVAGALTGNGTDVGTPWAWASGLALRIGGRHGAGSEPMGRYGEPRAA